MARHRQENSVENRTFYKTVLALVLPMALQNLINVGVQSADVIMLGRVGESAISAASLAGQVQFVMMLVLFGLSSGASVLTAQYWGKGDVRAIERIIAISLRISVAVALVFFLAAELFPYSLMRIFTSDTAVIEGGVSYLRFVAPGYLIISFTNTYLNILRSVEKVKFPALVYSVSLVSNIILNAVFIFGLMGVPAMGVAGAALATTLSRVIELFIVAVYASRNRLVRLRKEHFFSRHTVLMKDFMKYSMPTTLNELLWGTGVAMNTVIIGHLGTQVVAANSVAQVMRQLAMVVSFGVANATAILVGKAIGAGSEEQARRNASRLIRVALAMSAAGSALIFLLRAPVAGMMELSPEADGYLRYLLVLMNVFVLLQGYNATMIVGVFRGGGDTKFGLYVDAGTMWCGSIVLGALAAFVFRFPVKWVLAILMLDEVAKMPLSAIRFKSGRWLRNVTRDNIGG